MEINANGKMIAAKPNASETEEQKLKKACKDFEAILVNHMFENMRKTVPEGGLFEKNTQMDIMESMYYRDLSDKISSGKGMGLGDAIFADLQKVRLVFQPVKLTYCLYGRKPYPGTWSL